MIGEKDFIFVLLHSNCYMFFTSIGASHHFQIYSTGCDESIGRGLLRCSFLQASVGSYVRSYLANSLIIVECDRVREVSSYSFSNHPTPVHLTPSLW